MTHRSCEMGRVFERTNEGMVSRSVKVGTSSLALPPELVV